MTLEIILRYLHFVSIFTIVATLALESVLIKNVMTRSEISRLAKIDALYGIASLVLLAAGLTLWFSAVGKPTIYYSKNWIFHTKILLFLLVGILSLKPTIYFLKKRKGSQDETISIPSSIPLLIKLELVLLAIIPLLAGLMSHGFGYFGN